MELEQMRQIDAIARTGTMSAAADELHISQPALSRSIQRLEAELGCALFDRVGRRVELNEAGSVAVDWARELLRDERLMREEIATVVRRARALRVASVAPAPLWRLTGLMVERFPSETLTSELVDEHAVMRGVAEGVYDLGIVTESFHVPGLMSCELMRESLSVTLPPNHPLAARRQVTFADLAGETFLIFTDIGFWREVVDRKIPGATYIEQRDRMVFTQLSYSTPHCTFISDAPFQSDPVPGRAVVPIVDDGARAVFYLIARADARGIASGLFSWVEGRIAGDRH